MGISANFLTSKTLFDASDFIFDASKGSFETSKKVFEASNGLSEVSKGAFETSKLSAETSNASSDVSNKVFDASNGSCETSIVVFEVRKLRSTSWRLGLRRNKFLGAPRTFVRLTPFPFAAEMS